MITVRLLNPQGNLKQRRPTKRAQMKGEVKSADELRIR